MTATMTSFGRLAASEELVGEGLEGRVAAFGGEGGEIEHASGSAAAAGR